MTGSPRQRQSGDGWEELPHTPTHTKSRPVRGYEDMRVRGYGGMGICGNEIESLIRFCQPQHDEGDTAPTEHLFPAVWRLLGTLKARGFPFDAPNPPEDLTAAWWKAHRELIPDELDARTAITEAWHRMQTTTTEPFPATVERCRALPLSPAAQQFQHSPSYALLTLVCRELQRQAGSGDFFLSCRTAAGIMGKTLPGGTPDAKAGRYALGALQRYGIITCTCPGKPHQKGKTGKDGKSAKGSRGDAARFKYIHADLHDK